MYIIGLIIFSSILIIGLICKNIERKNSKEDSFNFNIVPYKERIYPKEWEQLKEKILKKFPSYINSYNEFGRTLGCFAGALYRPIAENEKELFTKGTILCEEITERQRKLYIITKTYEELNNIIDSIDKQFQELNVLAFESTINLGRIEIYKD